jgi:predicted DNA-binding protein (MmcQ/YjbR family)
MNKKHWITVLMDGSISDKQILSWIDDSYALVATGLTRAKKEQLKKR